MRSAASSRCVWLHATTPADAAATAVLAQVLSELPAAPRCLATGLPTAAGPGDDPAAIATILVDRGVGLLVLVGNSLPVALIETARAQGVALMLVDALDPVPQGGWRILPGYTRSILKRFAQIHMRSAKAVAGLPRGVQTSVAVHATGALARLASARPGNPQELEALRQAVGTRPVWYAAAVPHDEVAAVLQAQAELLRRAHRLLLILQPIDAQAAAVAADSTTLTVAQRSVDAEIDEATQVYLADADDPPGLFLRLATVCYLGGSLGEAAVALPVAEAAALGSALVFGPGAQGPALDLLERLHSVGGGQLIGASGELANAVAHLLSPDIGAQAALRAWTLVSEGAEASLTVAHAIIDHMTLAGVAP